MKRNLLLLVGLLLAGLTSLSAQRTIAGTVTDESGEGLIGAYVTVKGTSLGTITDIDGNYSLQLPNGASGLVFSFIGFATQEVVIEDSDRIDITLYEGTELDEIVLIGSRAAGRTKLTTAVPVDILNMSDVSSVSAQPTVNSLLNYVAPSFSSNTQTISDGTDHIDPASLRALGPDQVLVLINGKRRHTTALVNVNGTFGRGNVGTDLNSIPVAAIDRIEILRDGAAAQYGSDAIAGVINIILKDDVGLNFSAETGAHLSSEIPDPDGSADGEFNRISANYGIAVGENGGFLNVTGTFDDRAYTNRMKEWRGSIFSGYNVPGFTGDLAEDVTEDELRRRGLDRTDFRMRVGQSAIRNAGVMANFELPLSSTSTFYAFTGLNYRRGNAAGFYRLPNQSRTVTDIYPNGFLPEINSDIQDRSIGVGMRTLYKNWEVDFSNVFGRNTFNYLITNTLNASLESSSPTSFNSGGFGFSQNTTNLDIRRYWDDIFSGFNFAFGAEYRLENYEIMAGEEASYTNYGLATEYVTNGGDTLLIQDGEGPVSTVFDPLGRARPGGAQVFPGFSPDNERNAFRNSVAFYMDMEADLTESFLIGLAGRFENYSDFGSTLNGKLSTRYLINENTTIRAAVSTGFRAPSLHQLNFNSTSTIFIDGVPFEVGTFSNDSRVAQLLGIPELKEETSVNVSGGLAFRIPSANLSITIDGYLIDIQDRVVLTGNFSASSGSNPTQQEQIGTLLAQANANRANFFTNAIDTRTTGIDIVINHTGKLGANGQLRTTLAGTLAQNELQEVNTAGILEGLEDTYFDRTNQIFLEAAVPRTKFNLTFDYSNGRFGALLRNVYFGSVQEATNNADNAQTFDAKIVTDLSLRYALSDRLSLTLGANNLLDVYPDLNREENQSGGRFLYSRRSQQFGANGRYVFLRANFSLL